MYYFPLWYETSRLLFISSQYAAGTNSTVVLHRLQDLDKSCFTSCFFDSDVVSIYDLSQACYVDYHLIASDLIIRSTVLTPNALWLTSININPFSSFLLAWPSSDRKPCHWNRLQRLTFQFPTTSDNNLADSQIDASLEPRAWRSWSGVW